MASVTSHEFVDVAGPVGCGSATARRCDVVGDVNIVDVSFAVDPGPIYLNGYINDEVADATCEFMVQQARMRQNFILLKINCLGGDQRACEKIVRVIDDLHGRQQCTTQTTQPRPQTVVATYVASAADGWAGYVASSGHKGARYMNKYARVSLPTAAAHESYSKRPLSAQQALALGVIDQIGVPDMHVKITTDCILSPYPLAY